MTGKKTEKIVKPTAKQPASLPELWDKAKQNPALILALASAFGIGGNEIRAALEADVPGWAAALAAAVLPILYAAFARAKAGLAEQRETTGAVRDLQTATIQLQAAMDKGAARFDKHSQRIGVNSTRIGHIENAFRAELVAYAEKTRRETGRIATEEAP